MVVTKREVFILYTYCLVVLNLILIAKGLIWLELSNDGPAILDSTIIFFAALKGDNVEDNYVYRFQSNAVQNPPVDMESGANCSYSLHVPRSTFRQGNFTMTVTVYQMIIERIKVASNDTIFTLTDGINGDIVVYKGESVVPGNFFPTGENFNFTFHIHDPGEFFSNASLSCVWKIDNKVEGIGNVLQHGFAKTGQSHILLIVVAKFPDSQETKWGFLEKDVTIQDRIAGINVAGNTWIQHGKMLNLLATCNGSSPFHYCWEIYPGDKPKANYTCPYPRTIHSCKFSVHYYIAVNGQYYFSIFVANEVSSQRKSLDVLIIDTSHVPQLSVIIIPITCGLLAIIIVVAGVAYYLHQRKHYVVEVADFDFTQSEEMVERTFFGRLYDSIKNTLIYERQSTPEYSVTNRRATVRYGSLTNSRHDTLDPSTSHVC